MVALLSALWSHCRKRNEVKHYELLVVIVRGLLGVKSPLPVEAFESTRDIQNLSLLVRS
jgi:hypothetical protein